jgi:hypothetical protein
MVATKLALIAEAMGSVVDARMRARLQADYLTLLQLYHGGNRRDTPQMLTATQQLLQRVKTAQVNYKYDPGLGTIGDRFWAAWEKANAAMDRLVGLVQQQTDPDLRNSQAAEVNDLDNKLQRLRQEMDYASANVNLSRLDALANEVNALLAIHVLPRERGWSAALSRQHPKRAYPVTEVEPQGRSGVLSMYGRPTAWQQVQSELAGWYDDYTNAVTGSVQQSRQRIQHQSEALWSSWQNSVRALGVLKKRLERLLQSAAKNAVATELKRRWDDGVAQARMIAAQLKATSSWDDPERYAQAQLGADVKDKEAAILFYAADVGKLSTTVARLEADVVSLERR